jgi:hypothetical protein
MKFISTYAAIIALALVISYFAVRWILPPVEPEPGTITDSKVSRIVSLESGKEVAYEFKSTDGRICVVPARPYNGSMQCQK